MLVKRIVWTVLIAIIYNHKNSSNNVIRNYTLVIHIYLLKEEKILCFYKLEKFSQDFEIKLLEQISLDKYFKLND